MATERWWKFVLPGEMNMDRVQQFAAELERIVALSIDQPFTQQAAELRRLLNEHTQEVTDSESRLAMRRAVNQFMICAAENEEWAVFQPILEESIQTGFVSMENRVSAITTAAKVSQRDRNGRIRTTELLDGVERDLNAALGDEAAVGAMLVGVRAARKRLSRSGP